MFGQRYLEDFAVAQTFGSGPSRIDEERIKSFAAKFDPQPFHLDAASAEHTIFMVWQRAAAAPPQSSCVTLLRATSSWRSPPARRDGAIFHRHQIGSVSRTGRRRLLRKQRLRGYRCRHRRSSISFGRNQNRAVCSSQLHIARNPEASCHYQIRRSPCQTSPAIGQVRRGSLRS